MATRRLRWLALRAALPVLLLGAAGCDGRTAWREEPLPDYGAVTPPAPVPPEAARVRIVTELGDIVVALYAEQAPVSVANFLEYVDTGFYDGTLVHRVVAKAPGPYMMQGGGFDTDRHQKETRAEIVNEAANGLSNVRGTIAMARRADPDSASAQFYINIRDNAFLDYQGPTRPGYAVFGVVVEGMEVVDRISLTPVQVIPRTVFEALPVDPIVIQSARRDP